MSDPACGEFDVGVCEDDCGVFPAQFEYAGFEELGCVRGDEFADAVAACELWVKISHGWRLGSGEWDNIRCV